MIRTIGTWLLACWLALTPAVAQQGNAIGPNPTATGTATTGQIPGTTTNDNASAGNVGEYISAQSTNGTATVTITIASPGVITWTAHGLTLGSPVVFTTSGALPTGIVSGTLYWVIAVDANSFKIATTIANAIAGTAINTTGSQSGTQTGTSNVGLITTTATDIAFVNLTAGDWQCAGGVNYTLNVATTTTNQAAFIHNVVDNALPTPPNGGAYVVDGALTGTGQNNSFPAGSIRYSLAITTPIYLKAFSVFAVNTSKAYGFIGCRRSR